MNGGIVELKPAIVPSETPLDPIYRKHQQLQIPSLLLEANFRKFLEIMYSLHQRHVTKWMITQ
jgi:hypothetical protein